MADRLGRRGTTLVAALALVACCALPALLVAGGGATGVIVGDALRYWPLVLVGVVMLGWGVFRFAALRRSRRGAGPNDTGAPQAPTDIRPRA